MTKLLFGAAIAMIVISPALAGGGMGGGMDGDECKACPSWRSPASDHAPPWWLTPSPVSACRLVKARVGTRHGHAVYETRQVCG
jgi:hypothetical protein